MLEQKLSIETIKYAIGRQAEIGRQYPPEFITGLEDHVYYLLRERLNKAGMADEAKLLDSLVMLDRYSTSLYAKEELPDIVASDIVDTVLSATKQIKEFGGVFMSPEG